ncbi:hypothetical protein [Aureimonas sp. AU20]|uniref:hypothetical protein n=1 Tax=Aureimonas sp. AU20 TaxID=1349819 RepID=UPI00071F8B87|nr:hypothetical protein [Aureimonas sp. AU20]ALN73372.1 hypothetical protein M673_11635 [Aureimonas sp. AU20]
MTRVATSFALSLWLGFHAVTGLSELAHLAGIDAIGGHALEPAAAGTPVASLFVAGLTLGTAGLLAVALRSLHGGTDRLRRQGERLSFAGIGICSAMVVAAALFGPPLAHVFDRVDLAFWSLFLSIVALVFDHAVFSADDRDDELAFRKALAAIERSVPDPAQRHPATRRADEDRR